MHIRKCILSQFTATAVLISSKYTLLLGLGRAPCSFSYLCNALQIRSKLIFPINYIITAYTLGVILYGNNLSLNRIVSTFS